MKKNILRSKLYNQCDSVEKAISTEFQKSITRGQTTKQNNPMVLASIIWSNVSEQLEDVLGCSIHQRWFHKIRPLVVSNNVLILEATKDFDVRWINLHYQKLVDILLNLQQEGLSSFFVSPSDTTDTSYRQRCNSKYVFRGVC